MHSYADLKVADLRNLCLARGLQPRGNKTVLLERLRLSEQPAPVLKQEQNEQTMSDAFLESNTEKSLESLNILSEPLESLPYSPDEPELVPSSILQDDIDDEDDPNMDIDDSEQTPSEPMTPPLPSALIVESTKCEPTIVKQEPKMSLGYFSLHTNQGEKTFKSSPNDFAQIVVERKYLVNPAAIEQQSRKNMSSLSMANNTMQCHQQPTINGANNNSNLQLPYKYDQLFELTKHQWVYHDGETPWWFNYDTAAFAMKQPGVAVEYIFRR